LGDLNIDLKQNNQITPAYRNSLISYDFYICNKEVATRKNDNSSTIIDHAIVRNPKDIYNHRLSVIGHDLSDHNVLILDVNNAQPFKIKERVTKNFTRHTVDYAKLSQRLINLVFR